MGLTFANKITICRILAVPLFIACILSYSPEREYFRLIAFGIFIFAIISDIIDGYIARTWYQKTKAGAILDPLADKLLLISAFICLYSIHVTFEVGTFPLWFVIAVISRDIILLLGAMILQLLNNSFDVQPTIWGKATTFLQIFSVFIFQIQWIFNVDYWSFLPFIWSLTVFFTVISGIDYIRKGIKILNGEKKI